MNMIDDDEAERLFRSCRSDFDLFDRKNPDTCFFTKTPAEGDKPAMGMVYVEELGGSKVYGIEFTSILVLEHQLQKLAQDEKIRNGVDEQLIREIRACGRFAEGEIRFVLCEGDDGNPCGYWVSPDGQYTSKFWSLPAAEAILRKLAAEGWVRKDQIEGLLRHARGCDLSEALSPFDELHAQKEIIAAMEKRTLDLERNNARLSAIFAAAAVQLGPEGLSFKTGTEGEKPAKPESAFKHDGPPFSLLDPENPPEGLVELLHRQGKEFVLNLAGKGVPVKFRRKGDSFEILIGGDSSPAEMRDLSGSVGIRLSDLLEGLGIMDVGMRDIADMDPGAVLSDLIEQIRHQASGHGEDPCDGCTGCDEDSDL